MALIRCDNKGENVAAGGTASGSSVVGGNKWERAIDQVANQDINGGIILFVIRIISDDAIQPII